MATFREYIDPAPITDVQTVRERLVGQDIGINSVIAPLVETLYNRTETVEDRLVPVYSLLTADATRSVTLQHELIGTVAVPVINDLRSRIGKASAILTKIMTLVPESLKTAIVAPDVVAPPVPDVPYWAVGDKRPDGIICPVVVVDDPTKVPEWVGSPVLVGPVTWEQANAQLVEWQTMCAAVPPGPGPIPPPEPVPVPVPEPVPVPVPGPVPEPVPIPIPAPEPGKCIPICPVEPPKCPEPPKPPGPVPVPVPIPGPVPAPGPGPAPVPLPPDTPPEAPPDTDRPKLPAEPRVADCKALEWAHKDICKCVPQYVKWFSDIGWEFILEMGWADRQSANLHKYVTQVRGAAVGLNILKILGNKLKFNDPTMIDVAEALVRISEMSYQDDFRSMVNDWFQGALKWTADSVFGQEDTIKGLYYIKSALEFVEQHFSGYLTPVYGGPNVTIQFYHLKKIIDYCIDYVYPIALPNMGDVENLWLTSEITDEHANCLARLHGEQWDILKTAWFTRRTQPTVDDYFAYYYRNQSKKADLQDKLKKLGFKDAGEREIVTKAKEFLPPPSDIIRFAVKDVFDPTKLGRKEMLAELEIQKGLRELFDAQGMSDVEIITKKGERLKIPTSELYWLASYDEASPTQGYEFLHRLRRDRVERLKLPGQTPEEARQMVFEIGDLRKLLKEIDYNPIWRDRLAAVSYRVLGRIDVRRMYEFGVFGEPKGSKGFALANIENPIPIGAAEKEVTERYRDMGSTEIDARLQALFTARLWEKSQRQKNKTRVQSLVCGLLQNGIIDRQKAEKQLESYFETNAERDAFLDTCEASDRLKTVRTAIGTVKRQYLSFQIDENTSKVRLQAIGLQPKKVVDLINDWNLIKLRKPKQESASEMCGWLELGLIDRKEFLDRLGKLGYEKTHAERIVARCETGILRRSAKEAERIARLRLQERRRQEAAQEKILKERQRLDEKRLTQFLATRTEKHLIDWFREGIITQTEIYTTLLAKSYTVEDAQRWVTTYLKPKT